MSISVKYFITAADGNLVDWSQSTPGLSVLGKELQLFGGAGVDSVFVQAGSSARLTELGTGNDVIYLTGSLADYTQSIQQDTGVYTFTRTAGLSSGQAEVVKVTLSDEDDVLYFANGHLSLNALNQPTLFDQDTGVFSAITQSDLISGGTPVEAPGMNTPTTATSPARVFIVDAAGVDIPAPAQLNQALKIYGGAGNDSVSVRAGTKVDATELGTGNDVVYLSGSFTAYSQSINQDTGVYTFFRTVTINGSDYLEQVKVTASDEDDKLVFANGFIVINALADSRIFDQETSVFSSIDASWLTLTDTTPPVISSVHIASNNPTSTLAKVGDAVTLSFTTDGTESGSPTVTILGHSVTPTKGSGNTYTATYTLLSGDTEGTVTFAINAADAIPNPVTVTAVSDSSTVTFDKTAPTISSGTTAAVNENLVDPVVYSAAANESVTWSLDGTDKAAFSIASDGKVTLTGSADFETQPSYSFAVVATDAAGNSSSKTVSLTINDLDDAAPVITSGNSANPDENQALLYTAIGNDDGDDVKSAITWSLSGSHAELLNIASDGKVTLKTGKLDFETQPSYSFAVVATDAAGNSSSKTVNASVQDVLDAPTLSGLSLGDSPVTNGLTNDPSHSLSGDGALANATLKIYDGANLIAQLVATDAGDWSTPVFIFAEGQHTLSITQTSVSGLLSSSSQIAFTVDTTGPDLPVTSNLEGPLQTGNEGSFHLVFSEAIYGLDADSFLLLNSDFNATITSLTESADHKTFDLTFDVENAATNEVFTLAILSAYTDAAGNFGDSSLDLATFTVIP